MSAAFDVLRRVTTATITTMLLKKGIRHCWMKGAMPLVAGRPAAGRAGLHAPLRAGARGSRHARKLGQADLDPRRDRGDAGRLHRGRRRHGRHHRRHLRRHPGDADGAARRHRARHRRRDPRQGRLPCDRPADLLPGHGGAGLGQRAHLRRLERADRLWRLRDLSRRRDRRRRRRRGGDPAGPGRFRRHRRRGARALRELGGQRGRARRGAARPLSAERRGQGALRGLEEAGGG